MPRCTALVRLFAGACACLLPWSNAVAQNSGVTPRIDQDAYLRTQIRRRMRDRALRQRLGNEAGARRRERAIERANRNARRAYERALRRR